VLVTVMLLAAGSVWVLQAFARSWEASTIAQQRATAYLFALGKMGEIELRLREELPTEPLSREGSFRQAPQTYTWTWQATPVAVKPPAFAVDLVVAWRQGRLAYDERLSAVILAAPIPETAS
jgi:hypothetical protein